ncbi:MAG: hypothetical protein HN842_11795, partial [Gammaproteobacteria bacterium]|nr:hypothetical protein [Gammaproteobacteria bacterium]
MIRKIVADGSSERILFLAFIAVNFLLYLFAYPGATFIEGADATQYYIPALSFIDSGQFLREGGVPLTFGPPLYSIFLAIPIWLFGLDNSTGAIVATQCGMLYFTGYLTRKLFASWVNNSSAMDYGLFLHALVIFNPNSLITAHLIQSETLFTLLFVGGVIYAFRILSDFSLKNAILLGVLTGLATLTRPVSFYLMAIWPLFLAFASMAKSRVDVCHVPVYRSGTGKMKLLIPLLIGGLVISPWYARNYTVFGEAFFTSNAGIYLKAQYAQLKHKGDGWSKERVRDEHNKIFKAYLESEGDELSCLEQGPLWSCSMSLSRASLQAMKGEPLLNYLKTLADSWASLFLSGGASNIRNYLGFEGKGIIVAFQNVEFKGVESFVSLIKNMDLPYLFIFLGTTFFAVVTRVAGLFGVFYLFKRKEWVPYGILLVEVISIFTAAYLFLGQSRFRVPLEPLLMILAVVGVIYFS